MALEFCEFCKFHASGAKLDGHRGCANGPNGLRYLEYSFKRNQLNRRINNRNHARPHE